MSAANAPNVASQTSLPQAGAVTEKWSHARGILKMDLAQFPGVVMQDTFQNATGTWLGLGASGAGTGLVNPSSTVTANNSVSGKSLQVTANASSRYLAVRKFDITSALKLGFNVFFCYDSPVNVAYVHFEARWKDRDHGFDHIAGYRYNVVAQQWEFLPSTAASASGAWAALPGATTGMASGAGAWHNLYFDVDYHAGTYDEMFSGQLGFSTSIGNGLSGNPILMATELVEAQRMELRLGVETTASGAGNAWFADVVSMEVD